MSSVVRSSSSSFSEIIDSFYLPNDLGFYSFVGKVLLGATVGIVVGEIQERDLNPYPYFYDNKG